MKPLGVILAGGQSSRMGGGDKALLELGGKTVLEHVIERLRPQVSGIVLNANGDPARFAQFGLPVVADSVDGFAGPLAGVLAGMDWAADCGAEYIVTAAADTPFFPKDLVIALQMAREGGQTPLAMAMTPDPERGVARHPTFGLWAVSERENLRGALKDGVRKVVQWTKPTGCAEMVFNLEGPDPFFNINTPEDMILAQELLQDFSR